MENGKSTNATWRDVLRENAIKNGTLKAPGAQAAPGEDWVNVEPLSAPMNAFAFGSGTFRAHLDRCSPQERQVVEAWCAWLDELAARISFTSDQPVVMLAIARCALNADDRRALRACIDGIDEVIGAALQHQAAPK